MPREASELRLPHREVDPERVRQHQRGRAFGPVNLDMERATVRMNDRHGVDLAEERRSGVADR
jgi:hypothetical protein